MASSVFRVGKLIAIGLVNEDASAATGRMQFNQDLNNFTRGFKAKVRAIKQGGLLHVTGVDDHCAEWMGHGTKYRTGKVFVCWRCG